VGTQLVEGFVYRETGVFRCQFEEDAARFAEVQGKEIVAVDLRSDMQPPAEDLFPEFHLNGFVVDPEGDMVIGTAAAIGAGSPGVFQQVYDRCRRDGVGDKAGAVAFLFRLFVSKNIRQDLRRRLTIPQGQGHVVKTLCGGGGRYIRCSPGLAVVGIFADDQFDI